jgi:hypothetical protein
MSSAAAPTSTAPRKNCTCNNCHEPFRRRELDSHFLCATCRTIPGVSGYRDPAKRGLESGSQAYWDRTATQLNIVRDGDEPPPSSPATSNEPPSEGAERPKLHSEVATWIDDVFGAPIESDVKVYLLALQKCADYGTAANIFPGRDAIAAKLNWSTKKVRNVEAQAIKAGWIRTHQRLRNGWRRSSMLYQLLRPTSAAHGPWSGPDQIQNRKGTTTANSLKGH